MWTTLMPSTPDYVGADRWQNHAACKGMDPSMFVLDIGVSSGPAKKVCAVCTVKPSCDTYANDTNSVGVWGGRIHQNNRTGVQTRSGRAKIQDARPQPVAVTKPRRRRSRV
jgi:WhiB family redox-sensing transcriptional regulator